MKIQVQIQSNMGLEDVCTLESMYKYQVLQKIQINHLICTRLQKDFYQYEGQFLEFHLEKYYKTIQSIINQQLGHEKLRVTHLKFYKSIQVQFIIIILTDMDMENNHQQVHFKIYKAKFFLIKNSSKWFKELKSTLIGVNFSNGIYDPKSWEKQAHQKMGTLQLLNTQGFSKNDIDFLLVHQIIKNHYHLVSKKWNKIYDKQKQKKKCQFCNHQNLTYAYLVQMKKNGRMKSIEVGTCCAELIDSIETGSKIVLYDYQKKKRWEDDQNQINYLIFE